MVVAILANRFAPSSRGLRRPEIPFVSSYSQQHVGVVAHSNNGGGGGGGYRSSTTNYSAWTNIRNVRKATSAFRKRDLDDIKEDNENSRNEHSYDDRYIALGRQHNKQPNDGVSWNGPQDGSSTRTASFQSRPVQVNTQHRRKPFKAIAFLTSVASDMDLIADWIFYYSSVGSDRAYRDEWYTKYGTSTSEDIASDVVPPSYLIPPLLINLAFISCIFGTIIWIVLATDGRIVAPLCRYFGIDRLSMGFVLFVSVMVEDIPQIILTFMIEDYYDEGRSFSNFALCNVIVSFYDMLIKVAEAYDERNDLVETGVWCKLTIMRAHNKAITSVLILPTQDPSHTFFSKQVEDVIDDSGRVSTSMTGLDSCGRQGQQLATNYHEMPAVTVHQSESLRYFTPQASVASAKPQSIPNIRFVTASKDGSIRLWNTDSVSGKVSSSCFSNGSCRSMNIAHAKDAHDKTLKYPNEEITCLALFDTIDPDEHPVIRNASNNDPSDDELLSCFSTTQTYLLIGSRSGIARLWRIDGDSNCIRQYHGNKSDAITSIAVITPGSIFVTGYELGPVRLWEAWTGICIATFHGHLGPTVNVICCSLDDGVLFVTGGADCVIHLWETTTAMEKYDLRETQPPKIEDLTYLSDKQIHSPVTEPTIRRVISNKSFHGHTDSVLCICCIELSRAFISGSQDGSVRLWSVETGNCLRVFSMQSGGAVTSIRKVDNVTFLTGSKDSTIQLWDAISGGLLRVFSGHTDEVTDVDVAHDDGSFITTSIDRTIKIWVLTAVPNDVVSEDESENIYDGLCRGMDPL